LSFRSAAEESAFSLPHNPRGTRIGRVRVHACRKLRIPLLFVIPQRSGGICFCLSLVILSEAKNPPILSVPPHNPRGTRTEGYAFTRAANCPSLFCLSF
jgi:hypothetical protein